MPARLSPRRLRLAVCLLACLLAGCYDIQDTGDVPGGPDFAEAQGLNEGGEVVGYGSSATTNVATLWSPTAGLQVLPQLPGSTSCVANGVNENHLVVGACMLGASGQKKAVTWLAGQVKEIAFSGRTLLNSEALAVNANGEVAGTFRELNQAIGVLDFAFTWDSRIPGGSPLGVTPLAADLSGSGTAAAINSMGVMAGNAFVSRGPGMHLAYLWNPVTQKASPIDNIPTLPPGTAGEARGINDAWQIVGVAGGKGFLFTPGPGQTVGTVVVLPFEPYDINNKGQIVGTRPALGSGKAQAVLYTISTGTMQDLATQVPNLAASGWQWLDLARAINDKGQIAGRGVTTTGAVHGFVMTPR